MGTIAKAFPTMRGCGRVLRASALFAAGCAVLLPAFGQTTAPTGGASTTLPATGSGIPGQTELGMGTTGQAASAPTVDQTLIPAQNIPIGSGDLVDVEVFGTPELSGRFRVDQQGRITLPLGGTVLVQGMLAADAARAVERQLKTSQIMLAPTVSVAVLEYATAGITVLGEVRSPGVYTLLGPRSLYDALASAGGTTSSEGSSITITHSHDADHPVTVDVTTTGYEAAIKAAIVQPGDTVVVNRAPLVYVVGDVPHSGAFYLQGGQGLKVLDLVSLAEGTNRTAAMSGASIIRQTPEGPKRLRLDLTKVMHNQEPNLQLMAGDVLVVPRSGLKNFGLTALPGLTNAVSGAVAAALITR